MFLIKIEEITDPDYKVKSTDVVFKSSWEAEIFVYDMNVKAHDRTNDQILFKLTVAALIGMATFAVCVLYSASQDLHRLSIK